MNRLLEKIPTFLQDYREYIKITETEQGEFEILDTLYSDVENAQTFFNCPEKWIKTLYEEPLGIDNSLMSLDDRKIYLYNIYNNAIPYNKFTINNRIYSIIPQEKVEILRRRHHITIILKLEYITKKKVLYSLLEDIIPVDMVIEIKAKEKYEINSNLNIRGAITMSKTYTVKGE